jgi:hypothetical protein
MGEVKKVRTKTISAVESLLPETRWWTTVSLNLDAAGEVFLARAPIVATALFLIIKKPFAPWRHCSSSIET